MGPAVAMTYPCHGTLSPPGMSSAAAPAPCRLDGTPAAPDLFTVRGGRPPGPDPGVGRGTKREQREAVSRSTGLVPKHHPKAHPTPAGSPPKEEGIAGRPAPPVSPAQLASP